MLIRYETGKRAFNLQNLITMLIRSIGIAGVILGLLFKTLHWPGANIILQISAVIAAVTMTALLIQKPGPWNIRIQRPIWIVGSVAVVLTGTIFKTMHWPGANIQLMLGMLGTASWFLVGQGLPKLADQKG